MTKNLVSPDNEKLEKAVSERTELRPVLVRMRTAARIAAIQLAYSVGITGTSMQQALPEFIAHYGQNIADQLRVKTLDESHFQHLATGIIHESTSLDKDIESHLTEGWTLERLALHELSVLRAGIFELKSMPHIPARAVISEYAGMADIFQCDVRFVNAVLDQLSRQYRKSEMKNA